MKSPLTICIGDCIAFGFDYNGGKPKEIMVASITSMEDCGVLVHFTYGHHSLSQYVMNSDILAISNPEGTGKIKGWRGNFHLRYQDRILAIQSLPQVTKIDAIEPKKVVSMKISYNVYEVVTKTVCIPSDDYYSRGNDWQTQELVTLILVREFNEEQHAIEFLTERFSEQRTIMTEYAIIKTYKQ